MKFLSPFILLVSFLNTTPSQAQFDFWEIRMRCYQGGSDAEVDLADATDSLGEVRVVKFQPDLSDSSNILIGNFCKRTGTWLTCKDHNEKMKIVIDVSQPKFYASWVPAMSFNYYPATLTTKRTFLGDKVEQLRCR